MNPEQETFLVIAGTISQLPAEQQECINDMAEHIRAMIRAASDGEGAIAVALIGAELAANDGRLAK